MDFGRILSCAASSDRPPDGLSFFHAQGMCQVQINGMGTGTTSLPTNLHGNSLSGKTRSTVNPFIMYHEFVAGVGPKITAVVRLRLLPVFRCARSKH